MTSRSERIEKLVWEWRNAAAPLPSTSTARAMAFKCAEDLSAALSAPPEEQGAECYADPDAANQAFEDLRRERDALRLAGRAVVDAYRACREANSMAGFWTHLDDLAAELDGRAAANRAQPSPSPAETRETKP